MFGTGGLLVCRGRDVCHHRVRLGLPLLGKLSRSCPSSVRSLWPANHRLYFRRQGLFTDQLRSAGVRLGSLAVHTRANRERGTARRPSHRACRSSTARVRPWGRISERERTPELPAMLLNSFPRATVLVTESFRRQSPFASPSWPWNCRTATHTAPGRDGSGVTASRNTGASHSLRRKGRMWETLCAVAGRPRTQPIRPPVKRCMHHSIHPSIHPSTDSETRLAASGRRGRARGGCRRDDHGRTGARWRRVPVRRTCVRACSLAGTPAVQAAAAAAVAAAAAAAAAAATVVAAGGVTSCGRTSVRQAPAQRSSSSRGGRSSGRVVAPRLARAPSPPRGRGAAHAAFEFVKTDAAPRPPLLLPQRGYPPAWRSLTPSLFPGTPRRSGPAHHRGRPCQRSPGYYS
eukprot:scaffold751_cov395-Prasinococcus_capsulatus_cf.AAC.3